MITIECHCPHFQHREYLDPREGRWVIENIMRCVIAGIVGPREWIPCTECAGVAFVIDGCEPPPLLVLVGGGGR